MENNNKTATQTDTPSKDNFDANVDLFIKSRPNPDKIEELIELVAENAPNKFSTVVQKLMDYNSSDEVCLQIVNAINEYEYNLGDNGQDIDCLKKILNFNNSPEIVKKIDEVSRQNKIDIYDHPVFIDKKVTKWLEEAHAVINNNNEEEIKEFKKKLHKMSDKEIFQIDHAAVRYLVNNFTEENLQKVNNLRQFWGLKTVIEEDGLDDKNLRDIRRMEFSQNVSTTEVNNPHYAHSYSEAYRNFIPDYNTEYKPEQYGDILKQSPAAQMLNEHGFQSMTKQLPQILSASHVPPEIVPELCVKDLQHLLIEFHSKNIRNFDRRNTFNFNEVGIRHQADSAREVFWKNVVKDKKLIKYISRDLELKGISKEDIKSLWKNAEKHGNPNYECSSVFLQLHHRKALKDGGTNTADNFIIVVNIPNRLNSHLPLHEYDNPLVTLYKHPTADENGIIISSEKKSEKDIPVRLNTVFVADEQNTKENKNERVLYYGGTNRISTFIGHVNNNVRNSLNALNRIYEKIAHRFQAKKSTPLPPHTDKPSYKMPTRSSAER